MCIDCGQADQPVKIVGNAVTPADFWRSNVGDLLPDNINDPSEKISRLGAIGVGIADPSTLTAQLDVNGSVVFRPVIVPNRPAGGSVGTASLTVDIASVLVLQQTSANQNLTLPNPTNTQAGRILYVTNNGTASTTVAGKTVNVGETLSFVWDGNSWNGNAAAQVADFWRSGTTASTFPDNVTDVIEGIVHNGNVGIGAATPFTNATILSAALDVSGAEVLRQLTLPNFAANGAIGTAPATVDNFSTIAINQTSGNISLTIPNPTNTQAGRVLNISNIGTAQVTIGGQHVSPRTGQSFVFSGAATGWIPLGDNPAVIVVGASRNLTPTDHLKTLLVTAAVTLTVPANIGYLLIRVRQNSAAAIATITAGAGVTRVAPYGASTSGLNGSSVIVEVNNNVAWVE